LTALATSGGEEGGTRAADKLLNALTVEVRFPHSDHLRTDSSLGDAESSLGDAESSLGDAKSSLGDAASSLGDAESSLGDAKSLAGWRW
jgi:hypothetical protein